MSSSATTDSIVKADPIRALRLDTISSLSVWLAIGACCYASISIVLMVMNFMQCKNEYWDVFQQGCPGAFVPASKLILSGDAIHRLEFTAAFLFNCINLLIVAYVSEDIVKKRGLFKIWAFMNLLFSTVAMILVWADRPNFEVPAHQMEYVTEISMSFLETQLLGHGIEQTFKQSPLKRFVSNALNYFPFFLAVVQLIIFNKGSVFPVSDGRDWKGSCSFVQYRMNMVIGDMSCVNYGDATGEWYAHCLEYFVGFLNAIQAFFIALDNKMRSDKELQDIVKACKEVSISSPAFYRNTNSDAMEGVSSAMTLDECQRQIAELQQKKSAKQRLLQ